MTHTPTPWKTGDNKVEMYQAALVFDNDGRGVVDCRAYSFSRSREECEANAAFIAMACSSHDALIEAATRLAREAPCYCARDRAEPGFKPCGCCALAKIIATVKGKTE